MKTMEQVKQETERYYPQKKTTKAKKGLGSD
jgi:hypothetical protein